MLLTSGEQTIIRREDRFRLLSLIVLEGLRKRIVHIPCTRSDCESRKGDNIWLTDRKNCIDRRCREIELHMLQSRSDFESRRGGNI